MSPKKLWIHCKDELNEFIAQREFYNLKREAFSDIDTIPNLEIIDPCDVEVEDDVTYTSVKNKLLLVLNKQADHLIKNPDDAPIAAVSQAISTLDKMEADIANLAPLEDIIDNDKALQVVLEGSKYD